MRRKNFNNIFAVFKFYHLLLLFLLFFTACGFKTDPVYYDNNDKQTKEFPFYKTK